MNSECRNEFISQLVTAIVSAIVTSVIFMLWFKHKPKRNDKSFKERLNTARKRQNCTTSSRFKELTAIVNAPKRIITISENVYVAMGYGLANCIFIQGSDGCILIDTLEGECGAKEVLNDMEIKNVITPEKPLKAIILSHFHFDHCNGTGYFRRKYPKAKVYAHESFMKNFDKVLDGRAPAYFYRNTHQFGLMLPDDIAAIPLWKRVGSSNIATSKDVTPTNTVKEFLKISPVEGVNLVLHHAPGETDDQLIIWWPEKRILFPADNIYRAFPNLYSIRGTPGRDTLQWMRAVDLMRKFKPATLVPQHSRPICGENEVMDVLTCYRDAIQFTHDQTVRYMNKGYFPDEIVEMIDLPPHLKHHPYLEQTYGTLKWSIKGVFQNYMGWFSGRSYELDPLSHKQEAEEMLELLGGDATFIYNKAIKSLQEDKTKWSLKLCDYLLETGHLVSASKLLKAQCLERLAEDMLSFGGHNWLLTAAMELRDDINIKPTSEQVTKKVNASSMLHLFQKMTTMLDAEKTLNVTEEAHFHMTDVDEYFILKIRKGVLEVLETDQKKLTTWNMNGLKQWLVKVSTTSKVWRNVVCKETSALTESMKGNLSCDPGIRQLGVFMGYFDQLSK